MLVEEPKQQPLQSQPDPTLQFYRPIVLEELGSEDIPERARVMCHGYVTQVLINAKFVNFRLCDATSERECSVFFNFTEDEQSPLDDHSQIKIGAFLTVMAAKETRQFRGETHSKLKVQRYRVIKDVDQQMHWAISTLKTSRERVRTALLRPRPKPVRPVVVDLPLQYRTLLLKCLFKIVEETPQLNQITISLNTLLKNRELIDWCRTTSTEAATVEDCLKESLREYADVHFLEIKEQPQRPTKYIIHHRIFRELLSKICSFIKSNCASYQGYEATGIDPQTVHAYTQREIFGTNIRTEHLFNMEGLYLMLRKLQNDRRIYRTSDGRLFSLNTSSEQ